MANLILRARVCQRTVLAGVFAYWPENCGRVKESPAQACLRRDGLRRCGPLSVFDYIIDGGGEIVHSGARHDDRIPAAVRFLGDPEELAAIIFAEFHVEMLPFDLQLPRLDEIVHL